MNSYLNGANTLVDLSMQYANSVLKVGTVSNKDTREVIDTLLTVPWAEAIIRHVGKWDKYAPQAY